MTEVWILVDPVQDFEETLTILGVYGSRDAAMIALPRLRRKHYADGGVYEFSQYRVTEAQHWRGDQCVETWTYTPPESCVGHEGWRKS